MAAARCPPRSEPQKSHDFRPREIAPLSPCQRIHRRHARNREDDFVLQSHEIRSYQLL